MSVEDFGKLIKRDKHFISSIENGTYKFNVRKNNIALISKVLGIKEEDIYTCHNHLPKVSSSITLNKVILRHRMKLFKIKKVDLAREFGVSDSYIINLLSGRIGIMPGNPLIDKIAKALSLKVEDIIVLKYIQ